MVCANHRALHSCETRIADLKRKASMSRFGLFIPLLLHLPMRVGREQIEKEVLEGMAANQAAADQEKQDKVCACFTHPLIDGTVAVGSEGAGAQVASSC